VAEATADAATDAKGGGMEVIDVDDGTRTRMKRRLWMTSMSGTTTGTTAASACRPPIAAHSAARPRLLLTLEGARRRRVAAVDFPPAEPLSRSRERRGRRPPAVALQLLRWGAAQSSADDGTSRGSIRTLRRVPSRY